MNVFLPKSQRDNRKTPREGCYGYRESRGINIIRMKYDQYNKHIDMMNKHINTNDDNIEYSLGRSFP